MNYSRLFLQFLALIKRDICVLGPLLPRYIINFSGLYALMYGFCFGYLLPKVGMGASSLQSASVLLIGLILFALNQCAFAINAGFLFDYDRDRLSEYYLIIIPYWLLIVEKIIFGSVLTFLSMIPYYCCMKLFFSSVFDTTQTSIVMVTVILYLSCLYAMSFAVMFSSVVKNPTKQIRHFYRRLQFPMTVLGGVLVPWKIMYGCSTLLGLVVLFNPLIYVTEGLRQSFLGGDFFLSALTCCIGLVSFISIATIIALIAFKRKADAI